MVDARGRKRAAVISISEYRRLLNRLEQLEDALDLDAAARTSEDFREYSAAAG